jgi:hypothetical protein
MVLFRVLELRRMREMREVRLWEAGSVTFVVAAMRTVDICSGGDENRSNDLMELIANQ